MFLTHSFLAGKASLHCSGASVNRSHTISTKFHFAANLALPPGFPLIVDVVPLSLAIGLVVCRKSHLKYKLC